MRARRPEKAKTHALNALTRGLVAHQFHVGCESATGGGDQPGGDVFISNKHRAADRTMSTRGTRMACQRLRGPDTHSENHRPRDRRAASPQEFCPPQRWPPKAFKILENGSKGGEKKRFGQFSGALCQPGEILGGGPLFQGWGPPPQVGKPNKNRPPPEKKIFPPIPGGSPLKNPREIFGFGFGGPPVGGKINRKREKTAPKMKKKPRFENFPPKRRPLSFSPPFLG